MKILFISMNPLTFNSSGNIRNIGCLRGLLELGHLIDVLTLEADSSSINYDASKQEELKIKKYYNLQPNLIYKKLRTKKDTETRDERKEKFSGRRMTLKWIRYVLNNCFIFDPQIINVRGIKVDETYDLVISSSDPKSSHVLAEHIIRKNHLKCPWYQYWGDPMYDDITNECGKIKKWRLGHAEQILLSKSDRIIYTSPLTCHMQKLLYRKQAGKMIYSVQACTKESIIKDKTYPKEIKQVTLGYFGDYISRIRNIIPLVTAIKSQSLWKLVVAGSGDIEIDAENIKANPRLPYAEVEELEQKVDILVGICNIKGTQIPAKFYYMAGTQKPIILIVDGENSQFLRGYFEKYQRYIVCENQTDDIVKAIDLAVMQLQLGVSYVLPEEFKPISVAKKILEG